jgi:hypothetical protein
MEAHPGMESAYQRSLLRKESNPCKYSTLMDSAANKGVAAYQFDLPSRSRGVIEIICRQDGSGAPEILKLRGLDSSAKYELKSYASALARKPVWGMHDIVGLRPGSCCRIVQRRRCLTPGCQSRMANPSPVANSRSREWR